MSEKTIDPAADGVDHINIYTRGRTWLGRRLSNLADVGFTHPQYGEFRTVEGFWYYARSGFQHEGLRNLSGFQAKTFGKNYSVVHIENFLDLIKEAIRYKILQNPELLRAFVKSDLPFEHYYTYGNPPVVRVPKDHQWLNTFHGALRTELQHIT